MPLVRDPRTGRLVVVPEAPSAGPQLDMEALSRLLSGGRASSPAPPPTEPPSPGWGPTIARIGAPLIGLLGGPWGVAAGAGIGEAIAEKLEGRPFSPLQIGTQAAIGRFIPKPAQSLLGNLLRFGGYGAAATGATRLAAGERPTGTELATGAGIGAAGGGLVSALGRLLGTKVAQEAAPITIRPRPEPVWGGGPRTMAGRPAPLRDIGIQSRPEPQWLDPRFSPEGGGGGTLAPLASAARPPVAQAETGFPAAIAEPVAVSPAVPRSAREAFAEAEAEIARRSGQAPSQRPPVAPPQPSPLERLLQRAPVAAPEELQLELGLGQPQQRFLPFGRTNAAVAEMNRMGGEYRATQEAAQVSRAPDLKRGARELGALLARMAKSETGAVIGRRRPVLGPSFAPQEAAATEALAGESRTASALENRLNPLRTELPPEFNFTEPSGVIRPTRGYTRESGEAGLIWPEILARMGLGTAGALGGAVAGGEEHRPEGAILGGLAGAATPSLLGRLGGQMAAGRTARAATRVAERAAMRPIRAEQAVLKPPTYTTPKGEVPPTSVRQWIEKARYFSLLAGPAQIKNLVGNMGAIETAAFRQRLQGRPELAQQIRREFYSPQTIKDYVSAMKSGAATLRDLPPELQVREQGFLGLPGRLMGAADYATKNALQRAGLTEAEAAHLTFTGSPQTTGGQRFLTLQQGSPVVRQIVPFARTNIQQLEQSFGPLAAILRGEMSPEVLSQAGLGLGSAAAGGAYGYGTGEGVLPLAAVPYLGAATGPYSPLFAIGAGIGKLSAQRGKSLEDILGGGLKEAARQTPFFPQAPTIPGYLASYVPSGLKYLGPEISERETGESILGPAINRLPPNLAELLLPSKRRRVR